MQINSRYWAKLNQVTCFFLFFILTLENASWANECKNINTVVSQLEFGRGTEAFDSLLECNSDAIQVLTQVLKTDTNPSVRGGAADALGEIGVEASTIVPALIEALKFDRNASVRWRAISALTKVGFEARVAIPELTHVVGTDESIDVKNRAAYALEKIGFTIQGNMDEFSKNELNRVIEDLQLATEAMRAQNNDNPGTVKSYHIDNILVVQKALQQYLNSLYIFNFAKLISWTLGSHLLFWLVLIYFYPKNPFIQAFFFWNPWMRRYFGMGYVGIALTVVPFLRSKLFSPFKYSLLADANLENFSLKDYFPYSFVQYKGAERAQPLHEAIPFIDGQIVLEGESGLGKTMFIRYLAKTSKRIIVYLHAKRCNQGVIEAIQSKLHGSVRDINFLRTLIYSGGLDIIIDGLNEVTANTRALITNFSEGYFKGNILLTTQPIEWQSPTTAKTYELKYLNRDQIEQFLISRFNTSVFYREVSNSNNSIDPTIYKDSCIQYLNSLFSSQMLSEEWNSIQIIISNPMDLSLISQIIMKGEEPNLFCLQEQQYNIMAKEFQYQNLYKFPFQDFCEMVYQMRFKGLDTIPVGQFNDALICMERHKMVLCRMSTSSSNQAINEWFFRHEKIMDYFIVYTFLGANNKRPEKHLSDSRFRGVYFLLATLLPFSAAMNLREVLIRYAADSRDHSVSDAFVKLLISREILYPND